MSDEYKYDISDELTGKAHALAVKHISAYINECDTTKIPCIRIEHDPEGGVHHLFGISYAGEREKYEEAAKGLWSRMKVGQEVELFVSHGLEYDRVQCRNGDSVILMGKKHQTAKSNDIFALEDIDKFSIEEVSLCINYFMDIFLVALDLQKKHKQEQNILKVIHRALEVLRRIQIHMVQVTKINKTGINEKKPLHTPEDKLSTLLLSIEEVIAKMNAIP